MKRFTISILLTLIAIGLTITNIQSAQAEGITVKILEFPMLSVKADNSSGGKDISFLEPYSIEFSGPEALKYSTCESLVLAMKNFSSTWTIAGKSESRQISTGNVLYTIAVTKTGIQCALSKRVRDAWDTPYTFAPSEQSVPMTISISLDGKIVAESAGILRNPDFSQPAPLIAGLSRGDVIKGFARFQFSGKQPAGPFTAPPKVTLCPAGATYGIECGWGYIDANGSGVVIANPTSFGKFATLSATWEYLNSAGNVVATVSSLIGLSVQKNTIPIPWEIVKPLKDIPVGRQIVNDRFYLDTNLVCKLNSVPTSGTISCQGTPALVFYDNTYAWPTMKDSKIYANVVLVARSTADNCLKQDAGSIKAITGSVNKYVIKVVGNPIHEYAVGVSSLFPLPPDPYDSESRSEVVAKIGKGPDQNSTYLSGRDCHKIYTPPEPNLPKVPTGPVNKSSKAYKTMYSVGQNFAKVSRASDSANSQCNSALQTGMIKNNGIPRYLGGQTGLIQSYLQSASGFQGCLDGFGR